MNQMIFTCTTDDMLRVSYYSFATVAAHLFVCLAIFNVDLLGDCEEIRLVYSILDRFRTFRRPGSFLVDTFPALATNPVFNLFSNWHETGEEIHKADSNVFMYFWKQMKKEVEAGVAPHSFGREFVQSDYEAQGLDELDAAYTVYLPF
jgi:hypothetical protein